LISIEELSNWIKPKITLKRPREKPPTIMTPGSAFVEVSSSNFNDK